MVSWYPGASGTERRPISNIKTYEIVLLVLQSQEHRTGCHGAQHDDQPGRTGLKVTL
jgi:hypothetical protein